MHIDGRCGPRFNNQKCQPGAYCSNASWCGFSKDHKAVYKRWQNDYRGEGTEFQTPKYVKGRCGPDFNDQICQPGAFCSGSGWCGNSSEHMKITHDWNQYHGKGALGLWSQCDRSILWESTLGDTCEHPDVQVDWRDKSGRPAGNYCGRFCAQDLVNKTLLEPTDWIHDS